MYRLCYRLGLATLLLCPSLFAAPLISNLATNGIATASSAGFGSIAADINDGNRDGHFHNGGSVWHSISPDPAPSIEVDLGEEFFLDRVMAWPRTDAVQGTFENFRLSVFDATNGLVWTQDFLPVNSASNPWGTSAMRGVQGQTVRLERLDNAPGFLTFAELEIFGSLSPIPINLAREKPTKTSGDRADTPASHGNDGILDGDYGISGRPIYHSELNGIGQFWEVDLEQDEAMDYLIYFNRTDHTNTDTVRLTIRNAASNLVYDTTLAVARETLVQGGRQYDLTHDLPGVVTGRFVRIETLAAVALSFAELEVFGSPFDPVPPGILSTTPSDGSTVRSLSSTDIVFSENVDGVDAADLLINGLPASALQPLNPRAFTFHFSVQTNIGPVAFTWAPDPGITDILGNPLVTTNWTVQVDPTLPRPDFQITEFLTANRGGLEDVDDDSPDWIELSNFGPRSEPLTGWYLTDDPAELNKWRFPTSELAPGTPLVVFASDKNRAITGRELHTNFKLDNDGGYLALVEPDGQTVADAWNYGPQEDNVSYGQASSFHDSLLITTNMPVRYFLPTNTIASWASIGFNDASWSNGTATLAYTAPGIAGGFGPVGYWAFNDPATAASATDTSGYDIHGDILNAVYTGDSGGQSGAPGDYALSLAGNGVVDVVGAATGVFDRIQNVDGFTLSLWCYGAPEMPANNYVFFALPNDGSSTRGLGAHLPWSDSVIYFDTVSCCDPGLHRISIPEPDPTKWRGAWNHYAFVKNGSQKEIWQNGALLHSGSNTAPIGIFRDFFIGGRTRTGTDGYRGELDDVAVFEGPLPESAIVALAAGDTPLNAPAEAITPLAATDVGTMRNLTPGLYCRIPFTVSDPTNHPLLRLEMLYSDGFVAYLNGTEVARRNAPEGALSPGARATDFRTLNQSMQPETLDISHAASLLVAGQNVLAIHGLNHAVDDGAFLLQAQLASGELVRDRLMVPPSPGEANASGFTGYIADTKFNPDRGFYDAPFDVMITCASTNVLIVYTTDGSEPTLDNGIQGTSPLTVPITTTTPLRARAIDPLGERAPTNVDTHTYLFLDHVAGQVRPSSAPTAWPGNHPADFELDSRVVTNTVPGYDLRSALESLPSLMVTAPPEDLWGPNGMYRNSTSRGEDWERPASGEWMDPNGGLSFEVDFGLRIHGNISRGKGFTPKHGFKMYFRQRYGDSDLNADLFPGSPVKSFSLLVLRAGSTDTYPVVDWAPVGLGLNGEIYPRWQRATASYIRDQWVRDAHLALGQPAARGRFCHLYLNGLYWGLYNICERPDHQFAAAHFGGDPEDYDAVADFTELKAGNLTAWQQMIQASNGSLANDDAVQRVQGNDPDGTPNPSLPPLLDIDGLIDYFALHILVGGDDWPSHNWWALRRSRGDSQSPWTFMTWDQEISNQSLLHQRTSGGRVLYAEVSNANTIAQPYAALRQNVEFRQRFADRLHQHFFNDGPLSYAANIARWNARAAEVDQAIVAETARWGDYREVEPFTREADWLPHMDWMTTNYWPQIGGVALQRYRDANLYPMIDAPAVSPFGAAYGPGFAFNMTHSNATGSIYYTLDGSDPRMPGGTPDPGALVYTNETIALDFASGGAMLQARVYDASNNTWSALAASDFLPRPDFDLDGIDTNWEQRYGMNPEDPSDALTDDDQDGRDALKEYIADTHPGDPESVFGIITPTVRADGSVHLVWASSPERVYDILGATTPEGPWILQQSGIEGVVGSQTSEGVQPPPHLKYFVVRVRLKE